MRPMKLLGSGVAALTLILTVWVHMGSSQPPPSPIFKWKAEPDFVSFLTAKVKPLKEAGLLAFDRPVSLVAIPTKTSPVKTMEELEKGKVVGSVYLSTGSIRLNLGPGPYSVVVLKESGEWRARFLNEKGAVVSTLSAKVTESPPVELPVAFVDQSVCYVFDKTTVCV